MKSHALDSPVARVGSWTTFIDVLRSHAEHHPSRTAITFLENGERESESITFAELDRRARAIAAFLQQQEMQGQRAILLLPSGIEFITAFWGCLYAGIIAVPAFPVHFEGSRRGQAWFRAVVADAEPQVAFASPEMIARLPRAENDSRVSAMNWLNVQSIDSSLADEWCKPSIEKETIAFLQYTSGSTSSPKGVMISHENLLHNMTVIQAACNTGEDSTVVTWLPLYHDMGLIGTVLHPLHQGARCVLMAPTAFLQKPSRWLQAISEYRAHSSSAPNFAYELCARKTSLAEKARLDLSSWRVAVNGAEPVRPETMECFAAAFSECGFRAEAFHPSYGLAESTLMVTGGRPAGQSMLMRISSEALEQNTVREASGNEPARVLAGCGTAIPGQQLRIVDPQTLQECRKEHVGEIWISSPSVAKGYWNRLEETTATFHARLSSDNETRFLRTGDLGFSAGQQLFITGRLKDLIILHGRNLYPHDIELTVQQCHSSLRFGAGAAFAIEVNGQEVLAVINEIERHSEVPPEMLFAEIRKAVLLEHGIQVYTVALLKPGSIPKTTSGKIKRATCRAALLAEEMEVLASSTLPLTGLEPASPDECLTGTGLLQTEPGLRLELLESHLREEVARIAQVSPFEINSEQPLIGVGLDSVGASELASRIATEMGVQIDIASLLEGLSLSGVAAMIVDQLGMEKTRHCSVNSAKFETWPLSHGQKGLWILHKIAPNSVAYTLASAIRVQGRLDFSALEKAFLQIIERHGMLRVVFSGEKGEPAQRVQFMKDINPAQHVRRVDLTVTEASRLRDLLAAEVQQPFLLEQAPPIRLLVFGLPTGEDVLMLLLHHIIADLWSIAILLQEISAAYLAHCNGQAAVLPELNFSYLDFISWQSGKVDGPEGESLLNYWRTQLSGDLPVLQLPADRPRLPLFSYRGASESVYLQPDLYHKIQVIARRENVTPFMLLAGAFQVLLHRISGQDDVLLGSPNNGRNEPEFAGVVGYFVNPIVLRSYYEGSLSFSAYLAQVRQTALQALRHQDYPFPLLVEDLHPKREGGISPIFQAMFVWQELPGSEGEALSAASIGDARKPLRFAGALAELVPLDNHGSQFDLTLLMSSSGADLLGSLKYSTDLFDRTTIQRVAGQLSVLLAAITEDCRQPLSALPLMAPAERDQVLLQYSMGGHSQSSGENLVHELFEIQVEADPSAIALIAGERQMTFAQLNAHANQFARYLQTLDIKPEGLVGICLERSAEFIAAVLGIWKCGGVYVPLDTRDPQARLNALMKRTPLQAFITHEQLLDRLPEQLPPVVLLDLDLDVIAGESDSNLNLPLDRCNLAYVIHTSGSTGTPKGVMIEHRCLNNLIAGLSEAVYAAQDRHLTVGLNAPFTFDSSMKQLITLAMGHCLCLIPEEIRRNGQALLAYMQAKHLDVLDCTPTQVQLLLKAGLGEAADSTSLLLGGEPVPEHVWELLGARKSKLCHNVYGPTECTVDATSCVIGPHSSPSIGKPLAGTNVYILDPHLEPVPVGAPGEIFIGGHSVGRGYLNRPDLTAERFLPDSLSTVAGSRMYSTGDRARWLANGSIYFIGRADRQIKVRGFRIEPGEIEAALRCLPGVQDAAVVPMNLPTGSKQLVGYIASTENKASNHYRQLLAQTLPDYMLPAIVVSVPSIPVNAHGKKDYSALPVPEVAELERDDIAPPRSALEQYLVNLWTNALRVQPIGIHDNFFSLGGDSLQATRLITQIQQEYPSDMPLLALFFQEPTIASLARFVEMRKEAHAQSA
ncbi:MAG: non-ribosomal peptide synthetase [Candidatus Angelobacter sp. Gp1-AA117]|nr:MAG: non-ribosomal peptide synthetase [Candidatus Angelobacter sp. Gp1-AA117]